MPCTLEYEITPFTKWTNTFTSLGFAQELVVLNLKQSYSDYHHNGSTAQTSQNLSLRLKEALTWKRELKTMTLSNSWPE